MYAIRSYYEQSGLGRGIAPELVSDQYPRNLASSTGQLPEETPGSILMTLALHSDVEDLIFLIQGLLQIKRCPIDVQDDLVHRITSYNVCYTKLLRIARR